jgi:hypothetical protein
VSELSASEHVRSPSGFTAAFVAGYFERFKTAEESLRIQLRVPAEQLGLAGGVDLERNVVATVAWVNGGRPEEGLTITWQPESGGPFPTFSGRLLAKPDGEERSVLALEGQYVPPGGMLGGLFDGALGAWIARATAHDLLRRLRDAAEADYARRRAL